MNRCDIVIPVYNALGCVKECVESVLKNTDFRNNHLIIIDDASPDIEVFPMLEEFAKNNIKEITLLRNKKNLGFVGTVNRGMKYSKNDVLLLNSDTEVTSGWLDKIKACAYSGKNIATVTPLSNNATLASVPKIFEKNELPDGIDLEAMGKIVEKCSLKSYPEIPTAHGFCMYIKREALNQVGFFDEKTFGKGYGEENDFCFRCFKFGYRHLLCDDTYIFHKESQSFLESKNKQLKTSSLKLRKKYPNLVERLNIYVQNPPIRYIGDNLAMALAVKNKKPNILFVIHDWNESSIGGTTLHVRDIIKNLKHLFNFHVLAPHDGIYKVFSYFENSESVLITDEIVNDFNDQTFYSTTYKVMLQRIIDKFDISFVHIHHMIYHYFDLIDVLEEDKINFAFTIHDFYCLWPQREKKKKIGTTHHDLILSDGEQIDVNAWRKEYKRLLDNAKYIFSPSNFACNEVKEKYSNIKPIIIEHGIDIKKHTSNIKLQNKNSKKNIAFIGGICEHKGVKILQSFIKKEMIQGCNVHLFGTSSEKLNQTNHFVNHGLYDRSNLQKELIQNNIQLVCIFSLAPETYAYTAVEATASGIPIVTFNIDAVAERVKKHNLGWVVDYSPDHEKIAHQIDKILKDIPAYNNVIDSINNYNIKTTKKMATEYGEIYSNETSKSPNTASNLKKSHVNIRLENIINKKSIEINMLQVLHDNTEKIRQDEISNLYKTLENIKKSYSYRLGLSLTSIMRKFRYFFKK